MKPIKPTESHFLFVVLILFITCSPLFIGISEKNRPAILPECSLNKNDFLPWNGDINTLFPEIVSKVNDVMIELAPVLEYWHAGANDGKLHRTSPESWVSGFFPGILWQVHAITKNDEWMHPATVWMEGLESQKMDTTTHDVGFKIYYSYGLAHRATGNAQYLDVIHEAAISLSTRFSETIGCTKSWNWDEGFPVIIDNMMNLEILLYSHEHGGPAWLKDIAMSHANRTIQEHIRLDGSTYQVVVYDEGTGDVIEKVAHQGISNNTTWARGQSWAIYGFTMLYRYTNESIYLETAKKVADYWLAEVPLDYVPYWDFNASNPAARDTSAAAIAASGMIELSQLVVNGNQSSLYWNAAISTLNSLSSNQYFTIEPNPGIIGQGVQSMPGGSYTNHSLVFGDYYFLEALNRYITNTSTICNSCDDLDPIKVYRLIIDGMSNQFFFQMVGTLVFNGCILIIGTWVLDKRKKRKLHVK
ncbi:MAG: hypothetical protein ACFFCS_06430 [Candidatus Hodarchaeota archaeon]